MSWVFKKIGGAESSANEWFVSVTPPAGERFVSIIPPVNERSVVVVIPSANGRFFAILPVAPDSYQTIPSVNHFATLVQPETLFDSVPTSPAPRLGPG
jgi:hypothetical protein